MEIGRSSWLYYYLVLLHVFMLITLFSLPIGLGFTLLSVACLLLSFVAACRQYQSGSSRSSRNRCIERDESDLWSISFANDNKQLALKLESSFVSTKLVIIRLKSADHWRRISIVIVSDAVDTNLFRQLRVFLRDPKTFHQQ